MVNVFLFCIMVQIMAASREVQASSGLTHCREGRLKQSWFIGKSQVLHTAVFWSLTRELTAANHGENGFVCFSENPK